MILNSCRTTATTSKASDRNRALRNSIDIAVRTLERRHQERTALKAFSIPDRRDQDIDLGTGPHHSREFCRNNNGSDIFRLALKIGLIDADTHLVQHIGKRLEYIRAVLVPRSVESDDKAVSNNLVFSDTRKRCYILDTLSENNGSHKEYHE